MKTFLWLQVVRKGNSSSLVRGIDDRMKLLGRNVLRLGGIKQLSEKWYLKEQAVVPRMLIPVARGESSALTCQAFSCTSKGSLSEPQVARRLLQELGGVLFVFLIFCLYSNAGPLMKHSLGFLWLSLTSP